MEKIIKEQGEFIEFLKRNHLYEPLESANVMQKMQKLWNATKREVNRQKSRKRLDSIIAHCNCCLKKEVYDRIKEDSKLKIITTGNGTNVGYRTYYICQDCYDCYVKEFDGRMWDRL